MLPRFFSRVRVAKWLKRSSKRRPNPFYILQDLPPKDIFNAAKFPDLSHPRSSVKGCARAWSLSLRWPSLYGLHARAQVCTLELGVSRSSVGSCARACISSKFWSFLSEPRSSMGQHARAWVFESCFFILSSFLIWIFIPSIQKNNK